jgi:hypothetical protein
MPDSRENRPENANAPRQVFVTFDDDGIEVDATVIAEGMGIQPQEVLERLRFGAITTRCEKGMDEDEGRYRLTFLSQSRRLQLIVDVSGKILKRGVIDFGAHPLPPKLRSSTA